MREKGEVKESCHFRNFEVSFSIVCDALDSNKVDDTRSQLERTSALKNENKVHLHSQDYSLLYLT